MKKENKVLCGASAYEQKYYFNKEIGGVFTISFDEEGNLQFTTEAKDADYMYDEIGSALMIKEIQKSKQELLEELELFYKVVILKQKVDLE